MQPKRMASLNWMAAIVVILPSIIQAAPTVGGCSVFPANNIWNTPIDMLAADSDQALKDANNMGWVDAVGRTTKFHFDFAAAKYQKGTIGIPYNLADFNVGNPSRCSAFSFYYGGESDPGGIGCSLDGPTKPYRGYPVPSSPLIENGSDKHLLVVEKKYCMLYEVFDTTLNSRKYTGTGGSGAVWDLKTNKLRPLGWTSADAAGLPILAGLVRYDEAAAGKIDHAIRFTVPKTDGTYIWPASHRTAGWVQTNPPTPEPPPMGAHLRLKSTYQIPAALQNDVKTNAIVNAMKRYGIINADNGSAWFVSGEPNANWNDSNLKILSDSLTGNNFEAVNTSCLKVTDSSGAVKTDAAGNVDLSSCTLKTTMTPTAPAIVAKSNTALKCSYKILGIPHNSSVTGASGNIIVRASANACAWQVTAPDWIVFSSHSFTGTQMISYTVIPNTTGNFRTASLVIANQTFLVSQK